MEADAVEAAIEDELISLRVGLCAAADLSGIESALFVRDFADVSLVCVLRILGIPPS
jgi:hypothetical protein